MQFKPYNERTIKKEIASIPAQDQSKLLSAMKSFENGELTGFILKDYSDGIKMLTDSGRGQGRCIFFTEDKEVAVILKVYKKETQKLPKAVIDTAIRRKKDYEENK